MKTTTALLAFLTLATAAHAASFQIGQAADVVLGQPDFTSATGVFGQPNRFANPDGVAMDPTTGKVFVVDRSNSRILRFSSTAAAQSGSNPEAVLGQPNFTAHLSNQGGTATAATLSVPVDVCVDSVGRLWVADIGNSRVLGFYLASYLGNNPSADIVLGQANFTTTATGLTAATMNGPYGVSVGPNDALWVAELNNNRVLRFDAVTSKANGASANGVLGQLDFTSGGAATTAIGLHAPGGVYADAGGRLWVGDVGNNRVLRYDAAAAKANGAAADGVLGQPDFTTGTANNPAISAATMNGPFGVYFDSAGDLWVSEYSNRRVIHFPAAATLADGAAADIVLGQPDFITKTSGHTAQILGGPGHIGAGPNGSLLVADYDDNRVLRFSPIATPTPTPAPTPAPIPQPAVTIAGKNKITTTKAKLILKGAASDANGTLVRVEIKVGKSAYKRAAGTASWSFTAKLLPGKNAILVRAVDASGATSAAVKVVVTRN